MPFFDFNWYNGLNMKKYISVRPWGKFEQFTHNQLTTVKIISVKPRQQLSLQYHRHRDEFWRILEGNPIVQIGNKEQKAKEGDEFVIPIRAKHRITSGSKSVKFLEISFGKFDENDIVRLEDKYGRK
jgi:mannose-6-phosphate isomerase-like protein (cupin superfamily)